MDTDTTGPVSRRHIDEKRLECVDLLGLAAIVNDLHCDDPIMRNVLLPRVLQWTDEQVEEASDWAVSVHLDASDNDVEVPQMPEHVAIIRQIMKHVMENKPMVSTAIIKNEELFGVLICKDYQHLSDFIKSLQPEIPDPPNVCCCQCKQGGAAVVTQDLHEKAVKAGAVRDDEYYIKTIRDMNLQS